MMSTTNEPNPQKADSPESNAGEMKSHPIGTSVGAVIGASATGAVAGSFAGPIGTVAGAIAGGVVGAVAGKAIAEGINPSVEREYWKNEFQKRPYYRPDRSFEDYEPAYRAGWESHAEQSIWEKAEQKVRQKFEESMWENEGGAVRMTWEEAREAAKDAYLRTQQPHR